jgi:hypothetical protein
VFSFFFKSTNFKDSIFKTSIKPKMASQSSSKVAPTNPDETYGDTAAKSFSLDDKQMKSLLDQGYTRGKLCCRDDDGGCKQWNVVI